MAGKIFISYRRDDSAGTAGRLCDRLAQTFGKTNLFIDVDNIPAGVNFVTHLSKQLGICNVFVCTVGPNWLNAKDDEGNRRLDQPNDYVRTEIAAALKRDIPVIPVLVDGARVPKARDLPDDIVALTERNAVEVRNSLFGRDADALTQQIRAILKEKQAAPSRKVVAVILGSIALFIFGFFGLYPPGRALLPWVLPPTAPGKDTVSTSNTLPSNHEVSSTNQTSKEPVSSSTAASPSSSPLKPDPSSANQPSPQDTSHSSPPKPDVSSANQTGKEPVSPSQPSPEDTPHSLPPKPDVSSGRQNTDTNTSLTDLITDCDRLAASPSDLQRPRGVVGVRQFASVAVELALAACNDAVSKYPDVGRFSYERGRVLVAKKDYSAAHKQFEQAVRLGSAAAFAGIAFLYRNGNGVTEDLSEAWRWDEKGAAAGDPTAMSNLGSVYANGRVVPQNYAEARRWWDKAAAVGDPTAMVNIGTLYHHGRGVMQDYAAAKRWYEKAAAANNPLAMLNIGDLYRDGRGVIKSVVDARAWYQKAQAAGSPDAQSRLDVLPKR
jgi:tetratricopeptide (TPR) repeat protein